MAIVRLVLRLPFVDREAPMTEDLRDGAFAVLELLAIPVLVPVALGLAVWRWLRRPERVELPVAPTAHRGAEFGRLVADHRKPRTIDAADLYRAGKAKEDGKP